MKRIFTSISMALCLMASSITVSAQTVQLSEVQKKEIQKEVLPVVFEQIKEQTGLDILGWAQPQLTQDFVQSLPIFNNLRSGLRADTEEAYSVKPDSITINAAAISDLSPAIAAMLGGDIKVTFSNYTTTAVPMIGDMLLKRAINIEMPGIISVSTPTMKSLAEIKIATTTGEGGGIPIQSDMTISIPLQNMNAVPLLGFSFVQNKETYALELKLSFGEGLKTIGGLIVPDQVASFNLDYLVSIDLMKFMSGMALPVSLYGIPKEAPTTRIPMGDASVSLDFSKKIPVNYIALTSYENAVAKSWRKLWTSTETVGANITVAFDDYTFTSAAWTDSTYTGATIIRMTDSKSIVSDAQKAVQTVLNRVITELATDGEASRYKMTISQSVDANKDGKRDEADIEIPLAEIDVDPVIEGTSAIANVHVKSYDYNDKGELSETTEMDIIATADLAGSKVIKVDFEQGGKTLANAYFTSNIAGIVTGNDDIAVSAVKVTPVDGGIYVSGSSKAVYRIISMTGATVANGTVSGENAYIPTSSLAKGIYVIVITADGESQSVKFAR